jgi:hypothetical protein
MGDQNTGGENPPAEVKIAMTDALNKINVLTDKVDTLTKSLEQVTRERDEFKDVLYSQNRAKLLDRARRITKIPEEKLEAMSNAEIDGVLTTLDLLHVTRNPKAIISSLTSR